MTGFTENYKNKNKKGSEGHGADIKGTICTGELSVSAVSVRVLSGYGCFTVNAKCGTLGSRSVLLSVYDGRCAAD